MPMDCIIIDDEPHAVDVVKRYVEQISYLNLLGTFRNPLKAMDFLREHPVDLIFLDISMPHLTGIQFLQSLTKKPCVIFTTAFSDYAVTSYELDAIDYLVKPIEFDRFLKAVAKAQDSFANKNFQHAQKNLLDQVIFLKSGPTTHQVRLGDISLVEKKGNYLEVYVSDKVILIRANMNDIFSWLPAKYFSRTHKSFVVAINKVETIEAHQVKIGNAFIPIGATYRDEFLKQIKLTE